MEFFQTRDRLSLFYTARPAVSPKASIVFLHGVGEHIGRYEPALQAFAARGYHCYGFDQRGFGRSEGKRGHVHVFQDYVDDVAEFIARIVDEAAARPLFLFGHSMGSIVMLNYVLQYPQIIRGVLVFSCPLHLAGRLADYGAALAKKCSKYAPQFTVPTLIDLDELTDNPRVIDDFEHDPCRLSTVTFGWLNQFTLAREHIGRHAGRIVSPALICHGGSDRIAALSGAKALYERLGSKDKSLIVYPGFKHELLNHRPAESAQVLKETAAWLDKRLISLQKN
ncbi:MULTISPECIES: alpha/beta hydrolase [Methylomicrobium]|uniref:Lysophospholipase n=1 Tax=Methylomicrobium album BG8 TaxID=686340 RepID=H8GG16_METAL|nr:MULTISPECIES: alpha/beta hydrolase [Methylomicrobium]EIC29940.1 lysophospholipase [Methylomicrobium album BG8]